MNHIQAERDAILSFCRGFRVAAVLFAAFELDLFEHLDEEGRTADDLAGRLKVPPANLRQMLNALVSIGILVVSDGRYLVRPPLRTLLRRGGPDYLGDFVRSARKEYEHWLHASDIVRGTYDGPPYEVETLDPTNVAQTLKNVEQSNRVSAQSMFRHLDGVIPELRHVIDVGGGHGYHSELLLERAPHAQVTIYDLPAVIAYCQSRQASNPHFSRMQFVGGDAMQLDYDQQYDLVLLNDLLVYFDREEKLALLRRAHRALRPGGLLASVNQTLHNDGCTPPRWAFFSFRVFVTTGKGCLEPDSELVKLTQQAGFVDVTVIDLGDERTLITGRRAENGLRTGQR